MSVRIYPVSFRDRELIAAVSEVIGRRFNEQVDVREGMLNIEGGRDPIRNQVNSNWILRALLDLSPDPNSRLLGLTEQDLYVPVLSYVFGEAQLGGRAAVVSVHRFRNEFYGLPPDRAVLKDRLIRETIHELGHTWGLYHCLEPECVMHPCSYAEEIDLKSSRFCDQCGRTLHHLQNTTRSRQSS